MNPPALDAVKEWGTWVGSFGTLLAVVWAVLVHFRDQREARIAAFRQTLIASTQYFTELAASFQSHIVAILDQLFASSNSEAQHLLELASASLAQTSRDAAHAYADNHTHEIHERILYSLDGDTHSLPHNVRLRFESTIAPLAAFSPLLHTFFSNAAGMVLQAYRHELSVNQLTKYVPEALAGVWNTRAAGKISIKGPDDILLHFRASLAQIMAAYRKDVTLVDIISEALRIVDAFTDQYRVPGWRALWRHHKQDLKAPLPRLDQATYTDTLRKIVEWKLSGKKHRVSRDALLAEITKLEETLGPDTEKQLEPVAVPSSAGVSSTDPSSSAEPPDQ
jgi:hypothetical protein